MWLYEVVTGVIPLKVKGKFVRPTMMYGSECWTSNNKEEVKMKVAKMRILRRTCGVTGLDRIRKKEKKGNLCVTNIAGERRENRLGWFGHVESRNNACIVDEMR